MQDPDDPATQRSLFVDRVSESASLKRSLEQHRQRMDSGTIDTHALRNVLMFYGEGGVGKSELSRQLADWLCKGPGPVAHWGPPPDTIVDVVVRWDVNESMGGLDPLPLLAQLRTALGTIQETWPAFDLPFALLYRTLRPGEDLTLRAPRRGVTTLSEVASNLGGDLFALADVALSGVAGAGVISVGRNVIKALRQRRETAKLLETIPNLDRLIIDCETASGDVEQTAELAGRLVFMLTRELDETSLGKAASRPLVVVFVDHMERLQRDGSIHLGEATLNRLVARLPYFLFVITGRRSLRWHAPRPELPASGPSTWPLLSTESPSEDEPRQHAIGDLSVSDAEALLNASFELHRIRVDPDLAASLARIGWPLHLQTIVALARELSDRSRPLSEADLGVPLPHLVDRLLGDLPPDVAKAFRAACLLPYFDEEFIAAAAQVDFGTVDRLLQRQMVTRADDLPLYPYRVHDDLRKLVREAGSHAQGGWSPQDWNRQAIRALGEARLRYDHAMASAQDLLAIRSLALGLNISTENNLFDPWLVVAIRQSPSISGLAPLIAMEVDDGADEDLRDTVRFLQLRSRAATEDVSDEMDELYRNGLAIASSAGLWRAYDLRNRGRIAEALSQFGDLIHNHDDRPALYRHQFAITLRAARRYEDALAQIPTLSDPQRETLTNGIDRIHGRYKGASDLIGRRHDIAKSRRFQVELAGDLVMARHRESGLSEEAVRAVLADAVEVGHAYAQSECIGVLAEMNVFNDDIFFECIAELDRLSANNFQPFRAWPGALALRGYANGDREMARQAQAVAATCNFRTGFWTPVEVLLEAMGSPLNSIETQQVEPYTSTRDRWLALFDRIIDRARSGAHRWAGGDAKQIFQSLTQERHAR